MAQEYGDPLIRKIQLRYYVVGEEPSIESHIASDNKLIREGSTQQTVLNVDDLLIEHGNAQGGKWTLYRVNFSPRLDGLLTADEILDGDEYDQKRVKAFFRGYERLINGKNDDSDINKYIERGLPEDIKRGLPEDIKSGLREESLTKRQKPSGGRKSRKSSRKSRKSRKNKKSKKIRK
jgi:hypothetical protein